MNDAIKAIDVHPKFDADGWYLCTLVLPQFLGQDTEFATYFVVKDGALWGTHVEGADLASGGIMVGDAELQALIERAELVPIDNILAASLMLANPTAVLKRVSQ